MAATAPKPHFTPQLFRFLRRLDRHNDRAWFQRNRDEYIEHVRDPMLRFIEALAPRLRRISRHVVADPAPRGGSMFRIHRDMRFVTDGRPYKTAATARFAHEQEGAGPAPGFYLHLGAREVYAGSGLWRPDGATAARIRGRIAADGGAWKRVVRGRAFREGAVRLDGDVLKRPPRGIAPDHPLIEDLRRRDFVTRSDLDEAAACAPDFLDRYVAACRAASPFVRFLARALDLPW